MTHDTTGKETTGKIEREPRLRLKPSLGGTWSVPHGDDNVTVWVLRPRLVRGPSNLLF